MTLMNDACYGGSGARKIWQGCTRLSARPLSVPAFICVTRSALVLSDTAEASSLNVLILLME